VAQPGGGGVAEQVLRDFGRIWNVQATVEAFDDLSDVPVDYWSIVVVEDVQSAAGFHSDRTGQPFALVEYGRSWSLTASHECLEMLADPFGDRLVAGQSPMSGQGRVEFLVEVCDPSEDQAFAYQVNDVLVSDFYTPAYFDPVAAPSVRYSFTGAVTRPREVLRGGYLSWHEPVSDHWHQQIFFDGSVSFRDLGTLARDGRNTREIIDSLTPQTKRLSNLLQEDERLAAAVQAMDGLTTSAGARAARLRTEIAALRTAAQPLDLTQS
jgi:hypothetical protein